MELPEPQNSTRTAIFRHYEQTADRQGRPHLATGGLLALRSRLILPCLPCLWIRLWITFCKKVWGGLPLWRS